MTIPTNNKKKTAATTPNHGRRDHSLAHRFHTAGDGPAPIPLPKNEYSLAPASPESEHSLAYDNHRGKNRISVAESLVARKNKRLAQKRSRLREALFARPKTSKVSEGTFVLSQIIAKYPNVPGIMGNMIEEIEADGGIVLFPFGSTYGKRSRSFFSNIYFAAASEEHAKEIEKDVARHMIDCGHVALSMKTITKHLVNPHVFWIVAVDYQGITGEVSSVLRSHDVDVKLSVPSYFKAPGTGTMHYSLLLVTSIPSGADSHRILKDVDDLAWKRGGAADLESGLVEPLLRKSKPDEDKNPFSDN